MDETNQKQAIEIAEIKKDVKQILEVIKEVKLDCVKKDMCERDMSSYKTDMVEIEKKVERLWNESIELKLKQADLDTKFQPIKKLYDKIVLSMFGFLVMVGVVFVSMIYFLRSKLN